MNSVLALRLRRLGLGVDSPPSDQDTWRRFLEQVERDFDRVDRDRGGVRSSARPESMDAWAGPWSDTALGMLFSQLPVATFHEDFTAVGEWLDDLRSSGVEDLSEHLWAHPEELLAGAGLVRVVDVNRAAVEMLRLEERTSVLGKSPARSEDGPALASYIPQFEAVWEGSAHVNFEYAGHRGTGEPFYGLLHWSAPEVAGHLDLARVIVSIADITDRRLAEQQMEQLVRSKDDFLASVSHELRTPLTTVYGSAEALVDQWDDMDPEVQRELVGLIARESAELSHLVEDLLVAAQADLGTLSVVPRATGMGEIADWIVKVADGLDTKTLEIGEAGAVAWADPLRLKQIVRNLITNAIRYGGDRIAVRSLVEGERYRLTVADDGPGVPADRREAIFALYERAQPEGGLAGSVGVGLAVSRSLARLMGGDLSYETTDGWSRFHLDLPAAPVDAEAHDPTAQA